MKNEQIVVECTYNALIESVWSAITDIDKLKQWYFPTLTEFKPQVGFETRFDVEKDGKTYPHNMEGNRS